MGRRIVAGAALLALFASLSACKCPAWLQSSPKSSTTTTAAASGTTGGSGSAAATSTSGSAGGAGATGGAGAAGGSGSASATGAAGASGGTAAKSGGATTGPTSSGTVCVPVRRAPYNDCTACYRSEADRDMGRLRDDWPSGGCCCDCPVPVDKQPRKKECCPEDKHSH